MKRAVLIAALLLASSASASWLDTDEWAWDEVPGATAYRLYWSAEYDYFWDCQVLEVPASVCLAGTCGDHLSMHVPPGDLVFFVVSARNDNGESLFGPGFVNGAEVTRDRAVICP